MDPLLLDQGGLQRLNDFRNGSKADASTELD